MATIYICKCGRQVRKNTNADNTGNRDTAGCRGCPYLLPWGPFEHVPGQGFVRNVQGYECCMSKDIEYATHFCGSVVDKCSCYIASLDFDFLTRVSNWIKETYPGGELNGSFFTDDIRAVKYVSNGRYRMSIGCAQNKKGIAAKAALLHQFFDASGARLDMTPEEEKVHILAAIEAGKAKAQERKENMDYIISKHEATGRLYAYYKGVFWFWDSHIQRWLISQFAEDLYQEERPKRWNFEREHFLTQTSDFHQLDDYEVPSHCIEALLQCNPKTAIPAPAAGDAQRCVPTASDVLLSQSQSVNADAQQGGGDDSENPTSLAVTESSGPADLATSAAADADLPGDCVNCQCRTCAEPCDELDCESHRMRFNPPYLCQRSGEYSCNEYVSPETNSERKDAQCQKENAPSADAAATSDGSAARMCEGPDEEAQTTPAAASGVALESLHAQSALPQNAPAQDIAADAPSAQAFDYSGLGDGTNVLTGSCELRAFDFSELGEQLAEQAAEADKQFNLHYGKAQDEYLVSCIYLARIHELTAKAGRYGGGTWTAWYQSKGISEGSARTMVQNGDGFKSASVADLKNLPVLTKKDLNLIARNGVANQVVEAAGEGDSDRIQDILNQLKAVQTERDEARKAKEKAEQERDAARDAQANLSAMANKFSKQRDAAEQRVEDAERRAQAAEEDAAGWKQAGIEMQELVDQRDERIRELESGITVEAAAVDQEEIERRANELSEPLVKIINQQSEEIQQLAAGNTVSAQASVLEHYMKTMEASLLRNAQRAELASYDIGALDSLARALREFADSIDGIFEDRSEDND